jgi:hypothetical protein
VFFSKNFHILQHILKTFHLALDKKCMHRANSEEFPKSSILLKKFENSMKFSLGWPIHRPCIKFLKLYIKGKKYLQILISTNSNIYASLADKAGKHFIWSSQMLLSWRYLGDIFETDCRACTTFVIVYMGWLKRKTIIHNWSLDFWLEVRNYFFSGTRKELLSLAGNAISIYLYSQQTYLPPTILTTNMRMEPRAYCFQFAELLMWLFIALLILCITST